MLSQHGSSGASRFYGQGHWFDLTHLEPVALATLAVLGLALLGTPGDGQVGVLGTLQAEGGNGTNTGCREQCKAVRGLVIIITCWEVNFWPAEDQIALAMSHEHQCWME